MKFTFYFSQILQFLNCLKRSSKTLQIIYIKTTPLREDLFHANIQTDGRTERQNDKNSPFSWFVLDVSEI